MFGAHRDFAAAPEVHYVGRIRRYAQHFGDLNDDGVLERVVDEALNPIVPVLRDFPVTSADVLARLESMPRTHGSVLVAIMDSYAASMNRPRWIEKSPYQRARDIWELCPDARIIHIIRDPRSVVLSQLDAPWLPSSARTLAMNWRRFVRETSWQTRARPETMWRQLRYEDLIEDPERELRRLCSFVDAPFDPAMLDPAARAQHHVPDVARPWQDRIGQALGPSGRTGRGSARSRIATAQVEVLTKRLLAEFGYPGTSPGRQAIGAAANKLSALVSLANFRERRRLRKLTTPTERYQEFQRYQAAWADELDRMVES